MSKNAHGKLAAYGRVPSKEKFRCMICMTILSTGGCPYNDRCVFLHDPRLRKRDVELKPQKQLKVQGQPKDSFYWPDMQRSEVLRKLDSTGLPNLNQPYNIPTSFNLRHSSVHDRSLYSMWNHFVAICQNFDVEKKDFSESFSIQRSSNRLDVFVALGNNQPGHQNTIQKVSRLSKDSSNKIREEDWSLYEEESVEQSQESIVTTILEITNIELMSERNNQYYIF